MEAPVLTQRGWEGFLRWRMRLDDLRVWNQYEWVNDVHMERFHDDVKSLLLRTDHLRYVAAVEAHGSKLSQEPFVREERANYYGIACEIYQKEKKSVVEFIYEFMEYTFMFDILQEGENEPLVPQEIHDFYVESMDQELLCLHRDRFGTTNFDGLQQLEASFIDCEASLAFKNNISATDSGSLKATTHNGWTETTHKLNRNIKSGNKRGNKESKPGGWTEKFCRFCNEQGSTAARNHNIKECNRPDNPKNMKAKDHKIATLEAQLKQLKDKTQTNS
ncbi:hypothetical protein AC1031_005971 [Aphanomyces cochlioides]|nr:hypothetical protein AC1031_005971 [Aphanomyces cochlioides]